MSQRRKRLIEVAFPLEEVSADARIDKYRSAPHPQTLHPWWARRPLAACRSFIYASLIDDPSTDMEREQLLREVADLASWDVVRHPERVVREEAQGGSGLTGTQLLMRARQRILDDNGGKPPRFADPFGGGGAIPLEALRLGCEVEASDLNPVAVLILKGTVEYPQRFGQPNSRPVPKYIHEGPNSTAQTTLGENGLDQSYRKNPLASEVRFWGERVIDKVRLDLQHFYPDFDDGARPVYYLWCRTIRCPNCELPIPLLHSTLLGKEAGKQVFIDARLKGHKWEFRLNKQEDSRNAGSTSTGGAAHCQSCAQVIPAKEVRTLASEKGMEALLTSILVTFPNRQGKFFREVRAQDLAIIKRAGEACSRINEFDIDGLSSIPDEEIASKTLGFRIGAYGFTKWSEVFGLRQLLLMSTLSKAIRSTWDDMAAMGVESEFAAAICTYLGCMLSRIARENNSFATWNPGGQKSQGIFSQPKLSMVWDFAEVNPFGGSVGDLRGALEIIVSDIFGAPAGYPAIVSQRDASSSGGHGWSLCVTDPPYYQALDYAGLSDFFYIWLKRAIGPAHPNLFQLPLTPKSRQAIVRTERRDEGERERYLSLMASSFGQIGASVLPNAPIGVVFAHSDPDAWATLIDALINAELLPIASWPIDTESRTKVANIGKARLQTSVWMALRDNRGERKPGFLGDVMDEMRPVIRERLLYFWSKGIRGADFFISAIGPALSIFGRNSQVLRPDGEAVSVRDFLDIVRWESTTAALEQVLRGADLGVIDPVTRQYLTWVWSYSKAPLDAGEAIALCLATGASYLDVVRPHSIAAEGREKSKKVVRLRTVRQRAMEDEDLGNGSPASPVALIDQLQHAAWLWGQNRADALGTFRGSLGSHGHPGPSRGRMPPRRRRGSSDHQWPAGQQRHGHRATGGGLAVPTAARALGGIG